MEASSGDMKESLHIHATPDHAPTVTFTGCTKGSRLGTNDLSFLSLHRVGDLTLSLSSTLSLANASF